MIRIVALLFSLVLIISSPFSAAAEPNLLAESADEWIKIKSISNQIFLVIAAFVVALIITKFIEKRMTRSSILKKIKAEVLALTTEIKSIQDTTSKLTCYFKGTTATDQDLLNSSLYSLSSQTSLLLTGLATIRNPLFRTKEFETNLKEKKGQLADIQISLTSIKNKVNSLVVLSGEIIKFREQLIVKLKELQVFTELSPSNIENFKLHQECTDLQREFDEALNFSILDLESVESFLHSLSARIDEFKVRINRIPELQLELSNAAQRIHNFKGQVDRLLTENSLKLIEFNPYSKISDAEQSLYLFELSFHDGILDEADRHAKELSKSLRTAIEEVQKRITLKHQAIKDLESLERLNSEITLSDGQFNNIYNELKEILVEKHWRSMPADYQDKLSEFHSLQTDISNIKELLSDQVQKYREAYDLIKVVDSKLSIIENSFGRIEKASGIFTRKIQAARSEMNSWSLRLREAVEKANKNDLQVYSISGLSSILERCNMQKERIERLTKIKPYDLDLIELEVSQFRVNVKDFENAIDQMIRTPSQRPATTFVDVLENMIINNNTTAEAIPSEIIGSTNVVDSESNSGFRVIRVDDGEQNHDIDIPEAKRIIRFEVESDSPNDRSDLDHPASNSTTESDGGNTSKGDN
ncbi:hypothetical protein [Paenibacillus taichungensis]